MPKGTFCVSKKLANFIRILDVFSFWVEKNGIKCEEKARNDVITERNAGGIGKRWKYCIKVLTKIWNIQIEKFKD